MQQISDGHDSDDGHQAGRSQPERRTVSLEGQESRAASATGGPVVVLTADRTLMAGYATLLDGMSAASQTTWLPSRLMHGWVAPAVQRGPRGQAVQAPLGLRRLEAALLAHGFEPHEVMIVPPEALEQVISRRTRIIGVSSGDPLGSGMNSTTVAALFGGAPITSYACQKLLRRIAAVRRTHAPQSRLLLGGPGAWQFQDNAARLDEFGIDHLVTGYAEATLPETIEQILSGSSVPRVIRGQGLPADELPALAGATVMGMVELSRGCGWGCRYCTLQAEPMRHLPPATVLADVETNLRAGVRNIALGSEDFFRYGGQGGATNAAAIIDLLTKLRRRPTLRTLSIDHANISSVAAMDDGQLAEIARLLRGPGRRSPRPWVNLGVETASGRLLAGQGGRRKLQPFGPEGWAAACHDQLRRLVDHGYFPLVSLVIGMPGETPEDVAATSRWIAQLDNLPLAVVPLLLAPLDASAGGRDACRSGGAASGATDWIRPDQWMLLGQGMAMTFRHMPGLYYEHHRAAGVGLLRRVALQVMGQGYSVMWRGRLRRCMRGAGRLSGRASPS